MTKIQLPVFDPINCRLFALGRNAMYAACQMLGLRTGDEILTPAFDCDGALQPFKVLGLKMVFFRSDPHSFKVDLRDLEKRITAKTKLIHIVNHFGLPQDWDQLLVIRNKTNIPILEDNAYSLFSNLGNKKFGEFGDLSVFSLRKNLPLIHGGMLRLNNHRYNFEALRSGQPKSYAFQDSRHLRFLRRNLHLYKFFKMASFTVNKMRNTLVPPPLFSDSKKLYADWPVRDIVGKEFSCDYLRPMSESALSQLSKITQDEYDVICQKKRESYAWLSSKMLRIKGIKVLWPDIQPGIVPFCLNCLIANKRDIFLDALRKKYDVMAWPTLSVSVINRIEEFPDVELLGRQLFQVNLPADLVMLPGFPGYLNDLFNDFYKIYQKYS